MKRLLQLGFWLLLLTGTQSVAQQVTPEAAQPDNALPPQSAITEDDHVLTGVHRLSLGSLESGRNMLYPSFTVMQQADSNPLLTGAQSGWQPITMAMGSFSLQRSTTRDNLQLVYQGSGRVYANETNLNSQSHELAISNSVKLGRSTLLLSDNLTFSREASFGATYLQGSTMPAASDLAPGVLPNQSILTGLADRITNVGAAEIDYHLSREDSLTISATHSILHFLEGGYLSNAQLGFKAGYDRQIRHTTLGISYGYDTWNFAQSPLVAHSHTALFQYGYRVTARLALQAGVGPQLTIFNANLPTNTGFSSTIAAHYRMRSADLELTYYHGIGGGAGVVVTSYSDLVSGGATRRLSRKWSSSVTGGYSHNSAASTLAGTIVPLGSASYQSATTGVEMRRDAGANRQWLFSYQFQDQISGNLIGKTTRHVFGVGFAWQMRPIHLQ